MTNRITELAKLLTQNNQSYPEQIVVKPLPKSSGFFDSTLGTDLNAASTHHGGSSILTLNGLESPTRVRPKNPAANNFKVSITSSAYLIEKNLSDDDSSPDVVESPTQASGR